MKLEVGKKFRNHLGEEVKIVMYDDKRHICFYDHLGRSYTAKGECSPFDINRQHDLVEEVS